MLREYRSPYNTPILPIKKPNGNYQLVQDLRAINTISRTLHPVLANPCTLLTKLQSDWLWFSVLDLKDAFFCLPLVESSQKIMPLNGKTPKQGNKASLHGPYCHNDSKNSPTITGDHLAKELEAWTLPLGEGTLLQCIDDLLITTRTHEDCKGMGCKSLKCSGTKWI